MAANEQTIRVGFIGMGIMGAPMATNCLRAGFAVTVWNRTAAKAQPVLAAGAAWADSPAAVAAASDIVCSCVTNNADVLMVLLDETTGVLAGAREGMIVIDHSTVSPDTAVQCADALAAKGIGFLDAPVSGSDTGAKAGTLSIMIGGQAEHFERAQPVLEAMGKTITHCGPTGAGYTVKLCNQVLVSMNCLAAAEAISLAQGAGVDIQAMLKAVSGGAAGSWQLSMHGPKMAAGDFEPGFFVDYLLKDLDMAHQLASKNRVALVGTSLTAGMYRSASALGHGLDGNQAVFAAVRALQG